MNKKNLFQSLPIILCTLLMSVACTSKSEKTISEYLSKQHGEEVKLYNLAEERKITVADSIQILQAEAQAQRTLLIDSVQAILSKYKTELSDGASQILSTPTLRDAYAAVISQAENTLDSLKKSPLEISNIYHDRPIGEVLSVIFSAKIGQKDAPLTYFELTEKLDSCKQVLATLE